MVMRFIIRQNLMNRAAFKGILLLLISYSVLIDAQENKTLIPKWSRFQGELISLKKYDLSLIHI